MRKMGNKIGVVGAGLVGATSAFTLLVSGLVSELVLIDLNEKKAAGEVLDLAHGIPLIPPAEIISGSYADLAGSDIVIIAAGANQRPGETRMDLTRKNIAVFKSIVPEIVKYAPDSILLIVTNPVDVLTYVTLKLSGFPQSRVLGSGTLLDTSRLRYLLSRHAGIDARNIHTYVLGEHGDTELAAWSLTRIAGMEIDEYCDQCGECNNRLSEVAKAEFDDEVRNVAYTIIENKGATHFAVAIAVRRIVEAILRDEQSILTVSALVDGMYGIDNTCLSLPCIVGAQGVESVLSVRLDESETELLRKSADAIKVAQAIFEEEER